MSDDFDVQIPAALAQAVCQLFASMVKKDVQCGVPLPGTAEVGLMHVRSSIALSGRLQGVVSLLMPEPAACHVAGAFAATTPVFGSAELRDAVGELANIVTGSALARLGMKGISIGCPRTSMVTSGGPAVVPKGARAFAITCETERGSFFVEVVLQGSGVETRAA